MKTDTYISLELVTQAKNQKAMIFFFFLKSKYRTSVFYHYKPERLSELTGVSVNTVRKYVGWLKLQGYVRIINGNLWLRSTRKIVHGERLILVQSRAWTTWQQFENRVYAAIIKHNIKQQAFHYQMKRLVSGTLKEKINVRKLRKYNRTYGKDTKETETSPPVNSVRQIAGLFNRSKSWASEMLNRLQRMGYIKLSQQKELLFYGYAPAEFSGVGYVYYNQNRGAMILHHGTSINFNY